MTRDIDSINHVGMVVRNLDATVSIFESMGFTLTPFSVHSGAWKPGEPVQKFRAGNRCVMFRHNYLEVLASEDPKEPVPRLTGYLDRHQGGHIICFNSEDPHAVERRVTTAGIATSGVIPLQRDIDTPEGVRTAKFDRIQLAPHGSPEGYIQAARHLTPEYIYQPRYMAHPNRCFELSEATVVVDDLDGFANKYEQYLGVRGERDEVSVTFRFPLVSQLKLLDYRAVAAHLGSSLVPPLPCIAAVAFRTEDLGAISTRLRAQGFTQNAVEPGRITVPAEEAAGLAISFTA